MEYILAYRPDEPILNKLCDKGDLIVSWDYENSYEEYLFRLPESLLSDKDFNDWLSEKLYSENLGTVINSFGKNTVERFNNLGFELEDNIRISDLIDDGEICELIEKESFGGDIRKYINTLYGGVSRFSIDFSLFRSRNINITGFEPISIESVRKCVDIGLCDGGMKKNMKPSYPTGGRILEWAERVNDEWGLECGAMGSFHASGVDRRDIDINFDGFVIYDANKEVKKWCDDRWADVESWSDRGDLEFPYMYPSEYNIRFRDKHNIPRTSIRMWWD